MSMWETLDQQFKGAKIVDLSPIIEPEMPIWPGHSQVILAPAIAHENQGYYCQTLVLGEHTGAHMDCPSHMVPRMMHKTVDTYPPDILFGPAIKYDLFKLGLKPGVPVTKEQILQLEEEMGDSAKEGEIALFNFGWQQYWLSGGAGRFFANNEPGMSEDACILFAERKVKAVGSDTAGCDIPVADGVQAEGYGHTRHWLPNGIFIVEMIMNMDRLPMRFYFMAMPLKIKQGSGSPVRPIAIID